MSTRQFKRLAHSLYECKYHIVFCPKYRYKILKNDIEEYLTYISHIKNQIER
jgi:putative transposase